MDKSFGDTIMECLKTFAVKLVSFKNIGYFVAVALGCVMAKVLAASFQAWSTYMLILTALFFTSNALQKWILGRLIPGAPDAAPPAEPKADEPA
jgi:hypothetical protein